MFTIIEMYTEDTIINHHGFLRNVEKENKNERNKWTDGAKKTDMNVVGSLYNLVTLSKSKSLMSYNFSLILMMDIRIV